MTPGQSAHSDVLLYVEQEDGNRFRIQSDQLERIGEKLRGRRRFSVFNSIILPLIVSVATIVFSTMFQYISWINSVRLQNATDVATRAETIYEKVADSIGQRTSATRLLMPSVRDLSAALTAADNHLFKFELELKKRRFDNYYSQLRRWNESYDQLITDVDYDLDRPILVHAEVPRSSVRVFAGQIKKIDCALAIPEQLERLNLNKDSLKLQFAAIHFCFMGVNRVIDEHKGNILKQNVAFEPAIANRTVESLGHIYTMANVFRCYSLRRIDYYSRQKERSIVSPQLLWRRVFNTRKQEAERHFTRTDQRCNSEHRPT